MSGTGTHTIAIAGSGPLLSSWPQFTVELWLYLDYASVSDLGGEPGFVTKGNLLANGRVFAVPGIDGFVELQIDTHFTTGTVFAPQFVPLRRWFQFVYTFDGQTLWLLRNGNYVDFDRFATPDMLASDSMQLVFGGSGASPLQGAIDEIRVSHVYRDPDWLFASYKSMTAQLVRFVTPGSQF
jgi:hypothetical protein